MWGGDLGSLVGEDVARIIARQQLERQLQQREAEAQARMQLEQQQMAQRQQESAADRSLRERDVKLREKGFAADEADRAQAKVVAGLKQRQVDNQTGVRRMIGDFVVQRGQHPDAGERSTLQGMALQENVALPDEFTKPSPEELIALENAKRERDFKDFTRRESYQEGLFRGRPPKPGEGSKISATAADELAVMGTVQELGRSLVALGDRVKWSGVGGLGVGSASQFAAKNFGMGTPESQELRNTIGQIKGSIAKLRGGTSFTPNEQALLDTYTPGIDDNPMVIKSKLKSLDEMIAIKRGFVTRGPNSEPTMAPSHAPTPADAPAGESPYQRYLRMRGGE